MSAPQICEMEEHEATPHHHDSRGASFRHRHPGCPFDCRERSYVGSGVTSAHVVPSPSVRPKTHITRHVVSAEKPTAHLPLGAAVLDVGWFSWVDRSVMLHVHSADPETTPTRPVSFAFFTEGDMGLADPEHLGEFIGSVAIQTEPSPELMYIFVWTGPLEALSS